MKLEIIPDINIENTKLLGLVENINFYRPLIKRFKQKKIANDVYIDFKDLFEKQYYLTYEILITKENVAFYLGFDDRLKESIETELKICWSKATFKNSNYFLDPQNGKHFFHIIKIAVIQNILSNNFF